MIPSIILTSNYPVKFWWKEKINLLKIESFGLLCHSVTDIYCHNRFVYLSFFNIFFSVVYNDTTVWWIKIFIGTEGNRCKKVKIRCSTVWHVYKIVNVAYIDDEQQRNGSIARKAHIASNERKWCPRFLLAAGLRSLRAKSDRFYSCILLRKDRLRDLHTFVFRLP